MKKTYSNAVYTPVGIGDVKWEEGFFNKLEYLCITNTIDSVYDALNNRDNSAQFRNFHILAGDVNDEYAGSTHWGDGDCYKWLEAASYVWYKTKDFCEGDVITIKLDMHVRKIRTNAKVEASRNQVAFMRGPVVYCLEGADLSDGAIDDVYVEKTAVFTPEYKPELLQGIVVLNGKVRLMLNSSEALYSEVENDQYKEIDIQLIPYYAWNNRGIHEMEIYIPVI
ncbi:MAG: glycoside hydrolase family 127 protein [Eubacteriales bacterium]